VKAYDKVGPVLRIETVINNPGDFRVRKQVARDDKQRTELVELREGVAYFFRYREVSLRANARYLDARRCGARPHAGEADATAPDHREEECHGALLPGAQPGPQRVRAFDQQSAVRRHGLGPVSVHWHNRRRTVQKSDGR